MDGSTRFGQAELCRLISVPNIAEEAPFFCSHFLLGKLQLHRDPGKTLSQRIMDLACYPISLFQNGRLPGAFRQSSELNRQAGLRCQGSCDFEFFRVKSALLVKTKV